MAGVQILVVEDNEMQSKLESFLLEEAGHIVQIAESAEDALGVLKTFHPDLILMDLQLPGKDGLALTRELRLDASLAATPIIALTAYTDESDLARAIESGCNGCIAKPIDTAVFARQVRNYAGGTPEVETEVASDSGDLLAEVRNGFVAEGLEQCGTILKELKSDPGSAVEKLRRVLHRWAGVGGTLGFPLISSQARRIEDLLTAAELQHDQITKAVETTRRRFAAAARNKPNLPAELIAGLSGLRIGLVNFSDKEANRLRNTAASSKIPVVMERMKGDSIENQTGYGALIVNEYNFSLETASERPHWSLPAVFIGSRSSLQSFSKLPAQAYDFLIAPWDAEEVLVRLYRLIAKPVALQSPVESPGLQKRRPCILVADDDPTVVAVVSQVLQQSEMDCEVARGGKRALDIARRRLPDAIVLDVNMLDMDGFEVLKLLRNNLATREIPVLLLTARRDKEDIALGFASGANEYVVKPFRPLGLVERVNKMITASRKSRLTL
jgi:CheY-like chemotaxis protein